jgi:Na+/proline symporter
MHVIDYIIFVVYMLAMWVLGSILTKNKTAEDFMLVEET